MADAIGSPKPQRILLVDDEADILTSLKGLLEVSLTHVEVSTAPSGTKALAILNEQGFDLIVTDFKMPGMNGLEFLEEAKRVAPTTPRILITAFPDLNIAISAINDADIENFVTKPLEPAKVVDVVRDVLRKRKAQAHREQSVARGLDLLRRRKGGKESGQTGA